MMTKCIERGELPKSHHTYGRLVRDQHTAFSHTITLHSHDLEPNGNGLTYIMCYFLRVLEVLLVRMYELVFFKMVAAVCSCRARAATFSTNSHACVLRPNNALENGPDTIYRSIFIFPNIKQHLTTGQKYSQVKSCQSVAQ